MGMVNVERVKGILLNREADVERVLTYHSSS